MSDETVRINCVKDGCGTFPMDQALYHRYKQSGETWHCPAGHAQHFTESTESKLRNKVKQLQQEIKRLERNQADELKQEVERLEHRLEIAENRSRKEYQKANQAEQLARQLYDEIIPYWQNNRHSGVVKLTTRHYTWICRCGGYGRSFKRNREDAERLYEMHQQQSCDAEREAVTA